MAPRSVERATLMRQPVPRDSTGTIAPCDVDRRRVARVDRDGKIGPDALLPNDGVEPRELRHGGAHARRLRPRLCERGERVRPAAPVVVSPHDDIEVVVVAVPGCARAMHVDDIHRAVWMNRGSRRRQTERTAAEAEGGLGKSRRSRRRRCVLRHLDGGGRTGPAADVDAVD